MASKRRATSALSRSPWSASRHRSGATDRHVRQPVRVFLRLSPPCIVTIPHVTAGLIGKLERIPLDQLAPDWENPRFLPGATDDFEMDADIYAFLDAKYDAYSVAESIA